MTGRAAFTDEEWETVLEGPTSAGVIVATAERGGTFRETFAMAKAFADARGEHGDSELLDEIVSTRPKVDRTKARSEVELRATRLQQVRDAVALLEMKATPEELDEYRRFVLAVADRVAGAKEERGDAPVSDAESAAITEIRDALGA
jgi:hypothetical protein